jgi:hypothetical protein
MSEIAFDPNKYEFANTQAKKETDDSPDKPASSTDSIPKTDAPTATQRAQLEYSIGGQGGIESVNGDINGDKIPDTITRNSDGSLSGTFGGPLVKTTMSEKTVNSFWAAAQAHKEKLGESREVNPTASTETSEKPALTAEQENIASLMDNYDPETGLAKDGGEALHVEGDLDKDGFPVLCKGDQCNQGQAIIDKDGKTTGFEYNDINNTSHSLEDLKAAHKSTEAVDETSTAKSSEGAIETPETDDTPIPKPEVKLDEPVGAKGLEVDGVKVLNLNDSTNRDSGEAKNHLLDGQLNSSKNTFGTFEGADGKKYMGFYSEGFGPGDERSGVVELDANGKPKTDGNLGAGEGWKPAKDLKLKDSEGKPISAHDLMANAHKARTTKLKELGGGDDAKAGVAKLNQIQELQGRIDNLQAYAQSDANKDGGLNNDHMKKLNEMMTQLNESGAADLDSVKEAFNNLVGEDGAKLRGFEVAQKLNELQGQGFRDDEIGALREKFDLASTTKSTEALDAIEKQINDAIDIKRDEAHALSDTEKTKLTETIKELEARGTLTEQQQKTLATLKGLTVGEGLDKMGKYLQAEINNLAKEAPPKPKPKEDTRGVGDPIDFEKDADAQAFRKALGEENFKRIFGDNPESNPALTKVLEDYNSQESDKAKEKFATDLGKISKETSASDLTKTLDDSIKKLKENPTLDAKAQATNKENISKLEKVLGSEEAKELLVIEEKKLTDEQKPKYEELKKQELTLAQLKKDQETATNAQKAIDAMTKLSSTLKEYSVDDAGKLKRGEEVLFAKEASPEEKLTKLQEQIKSEYKDSNINFDKLFALKGDVSLVSGYNVNSNGQKDYWCPPCKGLAGTDTFKAVHDISNKYGDKLGFKLSDTNQSNGQPVPNVSFNGKSSNGTGFFKNLAADSTKFGQNFARNQGNGVLS